MAVTVVSTVGGATSNSYISIADADVYLENSILWATWDALTDENKGRYLINATRMIESLPLSGVKYNTTITSGLPVQALHFPRWQDIDSGGSLYVPVMLKIACCEQALYLMQRGSTALSSRQMLQADGVTSASIGDVSESYGEGASGGIKVCRLSYDILLSHGMLELSSELA